MKLACVWTRTSVVVAVLLLGGTVASADTLQFDLDTEFSGGTPPAGTPPWLTAIFDDTPGSVSLTLTTVNLSSGEFVTEWDFNLDPDLYPSNWNTLDFEVTATTGTFTNPTIKLGTDAFKADGDGYFDISFAFASDSGGTASTRFTQGDSVTYLITGIPTLTASSFNYLSKGSGNSPDGLYSAAHVQGIGSSGNRSGWITTDGGIPVQEIPEPGYYGLLGLGLGGLLLFRRRRKSPA